MSSKVGVDITVDEIRELIREVLREVLAGYTFSPKNSANQAGVSDIPSNANTDSNAEH
jgi:hypothetical protein